MTDSTQYPAVPLVLDSWQEAHRRDAGAINYLLGNVFGGDPTDPTQPSGVLDRLDKLEADMGVVRTIVNEKLIMSGPTGVTGNDITGWTRIDVPSTGTITADLASGVITVVEPGYYQATAYLNMSGTGNNNWYGLQLILNGVPTALIGGLVWTTQWVDGAVAGVFYGDLLAGETISMRWHPAGNVIVPSNGQLSLQMTVPA